MRWEQAKNLMLIFFLLLNIFLAFFLYREQRRYTLSPEQERAIISMFSQHRISWYIPLIRRYPPMRTLAVAGFDYDYDNLIEMFFSEPPDYTYIRGRDIFENFDARMVISNGYISFENPGGIGERPHSLTRESAVRIGDSFIAEHYPNYRRQDIINTVEDGFRIFYREQFRNYIIHSNFIELKITKNGITQADMQYGTVLEYSGMPREICSPDEALLTFIQRIRSIRPDTPVLITQMDLVYYQEEIRSRENPALHATPYYRIFIQDSDVPFMINAYTNVSIN